MNLIYIPFGGMLTGRIDWPVDGWTVSLGIMLVLAGLAAVLIRDALRAEPKRAFGAPSLPRPAHGHRIS